MMEYEFLGLKECDDGVTRARFRHDEYGDKNREVFIDSFGCEIKERVRVKRRMLSGEFRKAIKAFHLVWYAKMFARSR